MSTLLKNKTAAQNNEILETFEAGLDLRGFEVKTLRAGQGSLKGSYVTVDESGAQLIGAHIPPYQVANTPESYDPYRSRNLLLTKKELDRLVGLSATKGLTLVPVSVYNKGRFLKLQIALVRGMKKHDKREQLKKRDTECELKRDLKRNVRL